MKAQLDRLTLKDALATAQKLAPGAHRHTLPALAGAHLEAGDGRLTVTITNLEAAASVTVDAETPTDGTVLVDAKRLADTVKNGGDTATIVAEPQEDGSPADTVQVTAGADAQLRTLPLDDWPTPVVVAEGETLRNATGFDMLPEDLDVARRVATAASVDDARPVLTGTFFEKTGLVCATDSYRLHIGRRGGRPANDEPHEPLVPSGWLVNVAKLADGGAPMTCAHITQTNNGHVRMFAGFQVVKGPKKSRRVLDVAASTRTIEGSFPDFRQLIPAEDANQASADGTPNGGNLIANRDELVEAVTNVGNAVKGSTQPPILLTRDEGLRVHAGSGEVGEAESTVSVYVAGDPPESVAFNPRYLADALNAASQGGGGEAVVSLRDEVKPTLIGSPRTPEKLPAGSVLALLMPVRV